MFWWIVFGVFALVIFGALANTNDGSGGDISMFTAPPLSAEEQAKLKANRKTENYDASYTTPGRQILVLYGTAYGFSEQLARKLFLQLRKQSTETDPSSPFFNLDVQPRLVNMRDYENYIDLAQENYLVVLCSTAGDGVPPADARGFIDFLENAQKTNAFNLKHLKYAVLALGDTSYPHFCRAGKTVEQLLSGLGASNFLPLQEVDKEDWTVLDKWFAAVPAVLSSALPTTPCIDDYLSQRAAPASASAAAGLYSRTNPFLATIIHKHCLTVLGQQDDKEILHIEFDLRDPAHPDDLSLAYTSGDALGILPLNNPQDVRDILNLLGATGQEVIATTTAAKNDDSNNNNNTLSAALTQQYDLKTIRAQLLQYIASLFTPTLQQQHADKYNFLLAILKGGNEAKDNKVLADYIYGREVVDVLSDYSFILAPSAAITTTTGFELNKFLTFLRPLQPRYYSISSSPLITPDGKQCHITVSIVRYHTYNRHRGGICTTHLADRLQVGDRVGVFISKNVDFRLPASLQTPIIMVGPGTGIAPFRAFIQERSLLKKQAVAAGAAGAAPASFGENILYFGCRFRSRDYTYESELESYVAAGDLRLRLAFSRDGPTKVYVQHLIAQDGAHLMQLLLEQGAHFYICGDGQYMAADVIEALKQCYIQYQQSKQPAIPVTADMATAFITQLEKEKRLEKDVWIT